MAALVRLRPLTAIMRSQRVHEREGVQYLVFAALHVLGVIVVHRSRDSAGRTMRVAQESLVCELGKVWYVVVDLISLAVGDTYILGHTFTSRYTTIV